MAIAPAGAALLAFSGRAFRRWFLHLGGLGLIPLGLLDSSVVPIPGSMDLVTLILSSRQQDWWFYYALMATAGSVLGGFATYRLAAKGGKKTIERRLRRSQVTRINKMFERWGFGAIAVPALLPPPVPMVPFLLAAGAAQYPAKKFMSALLLGRFARYTILAYLAKLYGRRVTAVIFRGGAPIAYIVIGLVIASGVVAFFIWRANRNRGRTAN